MLFLFIQKVQKIIDDNVAFPCDLSQARSAERPSSVHNLRPGDIDVVAALGDSLTAGNGALALTTQHVMVENRGLAALIGKWPVARTLGIFFSAKKNESFKTEIKISLPMKLG